MRKRELVAENARLHDELNDARAMLRGFGDLAGRAQVDYVRDQIQMAIGDLYDRLVVIDARLPNPRARKAAKKSKKVAAVKSAKQRARKPTKR